MKKLAAVIFDMDGTLLDNNPYHLKAWQTFCENHGIILTEEEYKHQLSGKSSRDTMLHLFKRPLSGEEITRLKTEKEQLYREIARPHIRPIRGLESFLTTLKKENIRTGIASSATPVNLEFALKIMKLEKYFEVIVDSTMVAKGKPDPEIFLLAAARLGATPEQCLVFEDSINGICGAVAAGMKVAALTTAHRPEELSGVDLVLDDYREIRIEKIRKLFH